MQYSPYEEYKYTKEPEPTLHNPTLIATKTIRPVSRHNLIIKPLDQSSESDLNLNNHTSLIKDTKFMMPYDTDPIESINTYFGILRPILHPSFTNPKSRSKNNYSDFPYMY